VTESEHAESEELSGMMFQQECASELDSTCPLDLLLHQSYARPSSQLVFYPMVCVSCTPHHPTQECTDASSRNVLHAKSMDNSIGLGCLVCQSIQTADEQDGKET
jgi:hypothetical protein